MTCFLHIGAPKTGSTALQEFLFENRETLSRKGWEYPDVSLRGFGHHDIAFLISGGYPEWALSQERPLEDLLQELTNKIKGKSNVIISSENFYLYPAPERMASVLTEAGFPFNSVKIIVYVRRQDEIHASWYNQAVKAQGYTGTIKDCISETFDLWDYRARIDEWAHIFGEKNIIVRPYEYGTLEKNDIRLDFLKLLNIGSENFDWPEKRINTRLNGDLLQFQSLINKLPLTIPEKRRFHKELIALTAATRKMDLFDDPPLLSPNEKKALLDAYTASNMQLSRNYLSKDKLFKDKIADESPSEISRQGLTIEKLTYILGWILSHKG